jgi:hypothetical protein
MKKEKTTKSLLGAWVCELANNLMNECETPMTRTEAFRRAHLARELLEKLGQGKVTFQYEKQNGDLREAMGTLRWGIDPTTPTRPPQGEDSVTPPRRRRREPDSLNFTYWDLEKHGFRTFSAARIVKIIAVAIPNYKEVVEHVSPDLIEFV